MTEFSRITNVLTVKPGERVNALPSLKEQMWVCGVCWKTGADHPNNEPCEVNLDLPSDCEPFQAPEGDPA